MIRQSCRVLRYGERGEGGDVMGLGERGGWGIYIIIYGIQGRIFCEIENGKREYTCRWAN